MNIGLLEVDNNDCILLANQRFSEMSGYPIDFLIGQKGAELFLSSTEKEKLLAKQLERTNGISDSYELVINNKDGEERIWLVSGAPNYDLNGTVIGSIGLHFDITEVKKLEKQKQLLLEKLEKQNEQLLDYAHIVSHDLKSPLRSIHSLITFVKEDSDVDFNEKTSRYLNLIQEKTEKMDLLIQGILTYSKIENLEKDKEKIDLNLLVNSIKDIIFIPSHIKIRIKNELPIINNDLFRMQQLFQNLISNAVNYNDKTSGYVDISSEEFDDHYVFAVKDNGIGIEKNNQKKVFEMFKSFNSNNKSTGIGLSIVRRILKNENEKIWIESQKNIGTTFYFTIHK
jgi:PAS domain S-box-containing protein